MGLFAKVFGGRPSVSPTPILSTADLDQATASGPVIVNVWSPTCVPCRKLVPVLEGVATEYADRVGVVEVNSHAAESGLLRRLRVQATPTIIVFEDGHELGRMTGFRPRGWFDEMIRKHARGRGVGIESADRWEGKLAPSHLTVDAESGAGMTDEEDYYSGEHGKKLTLEDLVRGYPDE